MSFDPFTVAAVATAIGAGSETYSAYEGNKQADRAIASTEDSARVSLSQFASKAALERKQQVTDAERILGRIRVAKGESGNTLGGQERQTRIDSRTNIATINTNLGNNVNRINSERDAAVAGLKAKKQNLLLSGFLGGLQGLSTGLTLGAGLSELGAFAGSTAAAAGGTGATASNAFASAGYFSVPGL